jgi:hypothetical protein
VALSPDGKTVLTSSPDRTARLWDAATGKPVGSPLVHNGPVLTAVFSPNGKTVLTGIENGTAQLWDVATGHSIGLPLVHQFVIRAVAFSPDGKALFAVSGDAGAQIWDVATGKPIGPEITAHIAWAVAFNPDGKTVLTGSSENTARLWQVPDLPDDFIRVADWATLVTGLALDEQGFVHVLDNAAFAKLIRSSSAQNPRRARGPGSSVRGGRKPWRPSTRLSARGRSTRTWCSSVPAFTLDARGPRRPMRTIFRRTLSGPANPNLSRRSCRARSSFLVP